MYAENNLKICKSNWKEYESVVLTIHSLLCYTDPTIPCCMLKNRNYIKQFCYRRAKTCKCQSSSCNWIKSNQVKNLLPYAPLLCIRLFNNTLTAQIIYLRMTVNDEWSKMWKKAAISYFKVILLHLWSWNSSVSTMTRLQAKPLGTAVQFLVGAKYFSHLQSIWNDSNPT